jgi:hypothetical protein
LLVGWGKDGKDGTVLPREEPGGPAHYTRMRGAFDRLMDAEFGVAIRLAVKGEGALLLPLLKKVKQVGDGSAHWPVAGAGRRLMGCRVIQTMIVSRSVSSLSHLASLAT